MNGTWWSEERGRGDDVARVPVPDRRVVLLFGPTASRCPTGTRWTPAGAGNGGLHVVDGARAGGTGGAESAVTVAVTAVAGGPAGGARAPAAGGPLATSTPVAHRPTPPPSGGATSRRHPG